MAKSLRFICQAETIGLRKGRFPSADEEAHQPLDAVDHLAQRIGSFDLIYCAPQKAARDTADVMFKSAMIAPEIRDIDYGQWSGRMIRDVAREDYIAFHS